MTEVEASERARGSARTKKAADSKWHEMASTLAQPDYVVWQNEVIAEVHGDFIGQLRDLGVDCLPLIGERQYPVALFPAEFHTVNSDFTHLLLGGEPDSALEDDLVPSVELGKSGKVPDWFEIDSPAGSLRTDYYRLLHEAEKVRRWNMRGFELSRMSVNSRGQVNGGRAAQITYGQNCLTSHVLGYELYRMFCDGDRTNPSFTHLRPTMKLTANETNYVIEPVMDGGGSSSFHPMISVQAIVLFKDVRGEWRTWVMKRSPTVAAMPGFWQFPPAGGFEVFGQEGASSDETRRQFVLEDALIREFLEEIFNDADMTSDEHVSKGIAHRESPGFRGFKELCAKDHGVSLNFLGVVLDLVTLRSEYSFLIVDEGRELSRMTYQTQTGRGAFWGAGSSETQRLEDVSLEQVVALLADSGNMWNPSSAGLFSLFSQFTDDENSWLRRTWPDLAPRDSE